VYRKNIYDGKEMLQLMDVEKTYRLRDVHDGIMGLPGGQMIKIETFKTQSEYEHVTLTENDSSYSLRYELKDDTIYENSKQYRIFQLRKKDFLPIEIKMGGTNLYGEYSLTYNYSDIKTNDEVTRSISDIKTKLGGYTFIEEKAAEPHELLSKKLPTIELPSLIDQDKIISLNSDKVTLIDFWEYWCGPCIASFPKIEKIKNKYSSELNVIGITSDDPERSRKLAEAKGVTFQNVVGNKKINKTLDVRGWPTYLLIDKNGIVQKVFYGFSEDMDMEKEIEKLISE
jgi:thiol-disulfide isomerase/thioredoxin